MTKAGVIRCRFCAASTNGSPREAIKCMARCNNCRVDIQLKGQWTNIGYRIWKWAQPRAKKEAP